MPQCRKHRALYIIPQMGPNALGSYVLGIGNKWGFPAKKYGEVQDKAADPATQDSRTLSSMFMDKVAQDDLRHSLLDMSGISEEVWCFFSDANDSNNTK